MAKTIVVGLLVCLLGFLLAHALSPLEPVINWPPAPTEQPWEPPDPGDYYQGDR